MRRHPAPTFVFADLAGYTALTEQLGDAAGAAVAREFRRTMCALSRRHGAWQIKSMGDGVMIWAPDAREAMALAAQAVNDVGTRPDLLCVRVGVHTGAAVMRGCDWYGSAVNVAARLAAEAQPIARARAEGDQVMLGVRSPDLTEIAGESLDGQIYNVFTIAEGRGADPRARPDDPLLSLHP